jgi:O-antigen ligase
MDTPALTVASPKLDRDSNGARSGARARQRIAPRYWPHAPAVALVMLGIIGMRIHENVPGISLLHPAAIASYGGLGLLLLASSPKVIEAAFKEPMIKLMAAYWGWALLTAPFALWPGMAFATVRTGLSALMLAVAFLLCAPTIRNVAICSRSFLWLCVLLGIVVLLNGVATTDEGLARLTTESSLDSNDLAALMAMALPFGLAGIVRHKGWHRAAALLATGICAFVIMRTGSRGGTVAMLVAAVLFVTSFSGRRKALALLLLSLSLVGGWSLAPQSFRDRITTIASPEEDYNYTAYSGRKQIWARARGYILEHPVAGVGIGNFPIAEGDYAAALGRPAKWSAAHNAYVQAFAELGTIGGTIFLLMLGTGVIRAWRLRKPGLQATGSWYPEYLPSLGAYCTSAYFLSHAYFYPLFGLLAIVSLTYASAAVDLLPSAMNERRSSRVARSQVPSRRRTVR